MRLAIFVLLSSLALPAQTQPDIWKQVNPFYNGPGLQSVRPSDAQLAAMARLIPTHQGDWGCAGRNLNDLIRGLTLEVIPLAPGKTVFLVEAGRGCARGGQGANGAMWIIQFNGATPVLLASPDNEFQGWLYSIPPTTSHGYKDIVLGWHMGAGEADHTYFRFDGKSYAAISHGTAIAGEDGQPKIVHD